MKFSGICLITDNVRALANFYTRLFGTQADINDVHVEVSTDEGPALTIFSTLGMEEMAPGSKLGMGHGGFTVSFFVKDVDSEYERLKTLGVEFVMLPKTHPWGARSLFFKDPDGNIVVFACRVSQQVD
jgi:catechol 2,3-dioxygenase-like lactoylglutathione lyase family enzyme